MIFAPPALAEAEHGAIQQIDELRSQLRWRVSAPRRWLGGLRRVVFARAVQASNSIEGYDASLDDVIAAVEDESPLDANRETTMALQGYRDAMTYVLQLAEEEHLQIDTTLVRSLHFMMVKCDLKKRPGRWRTGSIYVRREPTNEVVYEGPSAAQVPPLVEDLVQSLSEMSGPALIRAAMAHLNLAMIHPFVDGNGRMARCLQTLVLTRERILEPVFCSIEEYLGRNTDAYYAVLAEVGRGHWNPDRDARPWVRFCLNAHYQQAQTLLWRVRAAEELWERCQTLAEDHHLPERTIGALCDAARGLRLRSAIYRILARESGESEIDSQTASRDLHLLVQKGLLVAHGVTRGRHYSASLPLLREYDRIRRAKPPSVTADLFAGADN